MSDREIMNAKRGLPMWYKPNMALTREQWMKNIS